MLTKKQTQKIRNDLISISSYIGEFMQRSHVEEDNSILQDIIHEYENTRRILLELDSELFGELKEVNLGKTITNEFVSEKKPFYTPSSFESFRKEVLTAQRNFEIYENDNKLNQSKMQIRNVKIPFLSISFDKKDTKVNNYFKNILAALQIEFETGERYSKDSIPEKIKKKIESTDVIIVIFVKRDELVKGGFATPSWLINELSHAQAKGKEVIAVVEDGLKDIAGLKMEKEVIFFKRDNQTIMLDATIKFLEALKEHKLI